MEEKLQSSAYQFIKSLWDKERTDSYLRLNTVMYDVVNLAISANLEFFVDDFINIEKNMRGGYWFGMNSNGKGMGDGFYSNAITFNNTSAIHSFEKFAGLKPYITKEGHRLHTWSIIWDEKLKYKVTGFDYESGRIYLVAYLRKDYDEKGERKLFNFNNKEWLEFRKLVHK